MPYTCTFHKSPCSFITHLNDDALALLYLPEDHLGLIEIETSQRCTMMKLCMQRLSPILANSFLTTTELHSVWTNS